MLMCQIRLGVLLLMSILSIPVSKGSKTEECKCMCSSYKGDTVCEHLDYMRLEIDSNIAELEKWAQFFPFVQNLRNRWKDEIISIVQTEMKKYVSEGNFVPKPENIIKKADDEMLNDSTVVSKPAEGEVDLAKNVSNLVTKVEMVENRTMEVEEELKSERRVRRHLEQEVKETQSSLILMGDQLQNVTGPVNEIMSHVQMVIFSSLEDMNRTIHEDHLQKLYYKVDGVVYQNETRKLDERLEHVETELHDVSNDSLVAKLAENVKSLEENVVILNNSIGDDLVPRMMMLEEETVKKDATQKLEEKMTNLLNDTELFKIGLVDMWSDIQDFKSFQHKLQNFSEEWTKSLESLQNQIEDLKNKTTVRESGNNSYVVQEHDYDNDVDDDVVIIDKVTTIPPVTETNQIQANETDWDYVTLVDEVKRPNVTDRIKIGQILDQDNTTCLTPNIKDPHLLADVEEYSDGIQTLIFGCRPIGRYAVSNGPIPVRCEMGSWRGPFSSCHQLPDEATIELLSELLKKEHPCTSGSGELPDPSDCSRFFKCSHGKVTIVPCPTGLHFNANLKVCDYPKTARCVPEESELTKQLQETVPPIFIEPNNLDKPNGLLGTGPTGQLTVHPRSSFTLHCLYPENVWGLPTWNVAYFQTESASRNTVIREGKNRISVTVTAAKEEDSGIYRCVTPFRKEHTIRVEVKAVHCSSIILDEEFEGVYYRPTPEGEHRILGTTAEFQCEEEQRVTAVCMADGQWSRGVPDAEECTLKKRRANDEWKCKPLDTRRIPQLILEKNNSEKIVMFKCAGRLRLIGNSFTRCRDDGLWSHMSLPKCVQ